MTSSREPDPLELKLLTTSGRIRRLLEAGVSFPDAIKKLTAPETADEYLARNTEANRAVEEYISSPEYLAKFYAAMSEPEGPAREQRLADLKRETFEALDIEALHRHIRAQNRRLRAEGVLPPEKPNQPT